MAKLYTTGPVHIFVGCGGSVNAKQVLYLGTGQEAPDIEIQREFEPVKNDIGGTMLPMDRVYEGQEAMISVALNRIKLTTLHAMQSIRLGGLTPGIETVDTIGTAICQEGWTYPTFLVFPYQAAKASMADLPAGYRFWSTFLQGPDRIKPGTRVKQVHVLIRCMRHFGNVANPLSGSAVGGQPGLSTTLSLIPKLYDFDVSGMPAVD